MITSEYGLDLLYYAKWDQKTLWIAVIEIKFYLILDFTLPSPFFWAPSSPRTQMGTENQILCKKAQRRMCLLWQANKFNLPLWNPPSPLPSACGMLLPLPGTRADCSISAAICQPSRTVANPSHSRHKLFETLPSGRKLQSMKSKTSDYVNRFPFVVSLINYASTAARFYPAHCDIPP